MEKENKPISNDTKEKEYKKFINFGKLYPFESTFFSNEENLIDEIKKDIEKKFKNSDKYIIDTRFDAKSNKIIPREEKLTYTKIDSSDDYFFGTFIRTSNSQDVLTNIKYNESNEKIDPNQIYFEYNTLFYIDYKNRAISFIKTEHIRNVYPFLETFFNNNNFLNVKIAPLIKSEEEIKSMIANSFSLTFYDNSNKYIGLKQSSLFDCEFGELTIKAKLKDKNKNIMKNLINVFKRNSDVKSLSASTDSEDIDILKSSFTKHVTIELSKNYKNDLDRIKQTLAKELSIIEAQSI